HAAVAGDDAVAQHLVVGEAEVGGPRSIKKKKLDEAPRIAEQLDPLARRQLARLVLALDARRAARLGGLFLERVEVREALGDALVADVAHAGSSSRSTTYWCRARRASPVGSRNASSPRSSASSRSGPPATIRAVRTSASPPGSAKRASTRRPDSKGTPPASRRPSSPTLAASRKARRASARSSTGTAMGARKLTQRPS